MLRIELMGGFRIVRDGQPVTGVSTIRLQSLIAYLTLHAATPVSRQQLAFLFWTDSREAQARTNLRQLLHHLRLALPESDRYLQMDGQNICWRPGPGWELDTALFEKAAADAKGLHRDRTGSPHCCVPFAPCSRPRSISLAPYPTRLQGMFDPIYPAGMQWYWKADFVNDIPDAAIDVHMKHAAELPNFG
jgi:hypothetical protein